MAKSVKVNYILNLINTGAQLLFPLVTFPYVSRVMLADGVGQVSFFNSIIGYISLFTCLGIPLYAVREIARVRGDIREMNRTAIEILLLHAGLTLLGFAAVALLCLFVPQIRSQAPLFLILSSTLLFSVLGCEWFYNGIEDFVYITIRSLLFKLTGIVLLFLLVRSRSDILWYGAVSIFATVGNNVLNFFRLRKYLHPGQYVVLRELRPLRHLRPALGLFVLNAITSIYLQLNTVLLGFLREKAEVGYYAAATKLMRLVLNFSAALATVMLPRLSHLLVHDREEFRVMAQKSYDFTLALTLPMSVGLFFITPYAIRILSGAAFAPAIPCGQILAPIVFLVGLSGVFGTQMLYPMGFVRLVITATAVGSAVDLVLCACLIPLWGHNGAAAAYLIAEGTVTLALFLLGRRILPLTWFKKQHLTYLGGCLLMALLLFGLDRLPLRGGDAVKLPVMVFCGAGLYALVLKLLKDPIVDTILQFFHLKKTRA